MRKLVQKRTYEVALAKAGLGPVAGVITMVQWIDAII